MDNTAVETAIINVVIVIHRLESDTRNELPEISYPARRKNEVSQASNAELVRLGLHY
jgi:hypothetical protein